MLVRCMMCPCQHLLPLAPALPPCAAPEPSHCGRRARPAGAGVPPCRGAQHRQQHEHACHDVVQRWVAPSLLPLSPVPHSAPLSSAALSRAAPAGPPPCAPVFTAIARKKTLSPLAVHRTAAVKALWAAARAVLPQQAPAGLVVAVMANAGLLSCSSSDVRRQFQEQLEACLVSDATHGSVLALPVPCTTSPCHALAGAPRRGCSAHASLQLGPGRHWAGQFCGDEAESPAASAQCSGIRGRQGVHAVS